MSDLRKALLWRDIAALGVFLAVLALTVYVIVTVHDINGALCTFRSDLQQRVDNTQAFLDEHPGSEPFPGISRATLEQQLRNQQRSVDSLSDLGC